MQKLNLIPNKCVNITVPPPMVQRTSWVMKQEDCKGQRTRKSVVEQYLLEMPSYVIGATVASVDLLI